MDPAKGVAVRGRAPPDPDAEGVRACWNACWPQGALVSAEELLERVWDENADLFTTTVKTTIGRLRAKLGDPPIIETVRDGGYRIGEPTNDRVLAADCGPPTPSPAPPDRPAHASPLLYGLLFTPAGAVLLVITNVLVRSAARCGYVQAGPKEGAVICEIPAGLAGHDVNFKLPRPGRRPHGEGFRQEASARADAAREQPERH